MFSHKNKYWFNYHSREKSIQLGSILFKRLTKKSYPEEMTMSDLKLRKFCYTPRRKGEFNGIAKQIFCERHLVLSETIYKSKEERDETDTFINN